jgi:pimeloyl-ACP methyl ester carboxylesterase
VNLRLSLFHVSSRRTIQGIAALFLMTIAIGGLFQTVSLFRERSAFPIPGRLVDVGGYKMHIYCTGHGLPTIVLDSGLGDSFISWQNVQPQIAGFVRVCSYDRAGMGYSEASPRPRTSIVFAEDLHQLLHNAGIASPYIFVGHSMAAYNIRLYASLFKSDVAGIVLVDGCHPDQLNRFPRALDAMNPGWIRQGKFLELTMPIGLPRLLGYCGNNMALRAAECTFNDARENAAERETFRESAALAKSAHLSSGLSLIVISHDPALRDESLPVNVDRATNAAWEQMQEELTHLSVSGTRIVAKGSGHNIQNDRPDVVIQTVHGMVERVWRNSQEWHRGKPYFSLDEHSPRQ